MTEFASCQAKSMQTVFQTNQPDTATGLSDVKVYRLKKQVLNADFNYAKLDDIDGNIKDTLNLRSLMPIFEPVGGKYKYYQLIATFKGHGYDGGEAPLIKDFHDILIIKTDNKNKIIDAFHYTLEWAEPPLQYDLFKSSAKDIVLQDNMDISQLKLNKTYSYSENNKELKEKGTVKLK